MTPPDWDEAIAAFNAAWNDETAVRYFKLLDAASTPLGPMGGDGTARCRICYGELPEHASHCLLLEFQKADERPLEIQRPRNPRPWSELALRGVSDMTCSEHGPQTGWACPTCFAAVTGDEDVPRSKTFRSFPFRRWRA